MSVSTITSNKVSAVFFTMHCELWRSNTGVGVPDSQVKDKFRTIDLDVDIGADAVDYKSVNFS